MVCNITATTWTTPLSTLSSNGRQYSNKMNHSSQTLNSNGRIYIPLLFKVWQRSSSCCCWYIVYHYCLRFDRGVVHALLYHTLNSNGRQYNNKMNHSSQTLNSNGRIYNNAYHYCLRYDRGVVHVVVVILSTITL
jgi:hypothetical protein